LQKSLEEVAYPPRCGQYSLGMKLYTAAVTAGEKT